MVCPAGQFWLLASAFDTEVQICHYTPKQGWKVERGSHKLGGNSKICFWIVPALLKRVLLGEIPAINIMALKQGHRTNEMATKT